MFVNVILFADNAVQLHPPAVMITCCIEIKLRAFCLSQSLLLLLINFEDLLKLPSGSINPL